MQVQLHLFDETLGKEIDFSHFTFDPIPNGMGEISTSGLYKAPDLISANTTLKIKVKWDHNPRLGATYNITLIENSNKNFVSKIPHQLQSVNGFYSLSTSNEFLFGSPPINTGPAKNLSFQVKVVGIDGRIKWYNALGPGQTSFGMMYRNNSLVSGWVIGRDGHGKGISKIYDQNGNDLQKTIQNKIVFMDYFLNQSDKLFLSNSSNISTAKPTQIFKLSSDFEIQQNISTNFSLHSFIVDKRGAVIGYYVDELNKKRGLVKVDVKGVQEWNISLPYRYSYGAKLVQINDQKYGLIMPDCIIQPCALDLIYYEFGINGEIINPGQTIVRSITTNRLIDTQIDNLKEFYIEGNFDVIKDILVVGEEVLFVFYAITKNYKAILIKGTQGSSLEYWWDPKIEGQPPLTHIYLRNKEGRLEWKTLCGQAICTFQLDNNLTFNPCF